MADFNIRVIVDPTPAQRGTTQVERQFANLERTADRLRNTITQVFAFTGLSFGIGELIRLADTYQDLQNRLRTVTDGTDQLRGATAELFDIANRNRQSFEGLTQVYARFAVAGNELGVSQREILDLTESVSQAVVLSGASAQTAAASLFQLSQGFSSGALRGEELNSVLEGIPEVARVIANDLNVTIATLRDLASEGQITPRVIIDAFARARGELGERFNSTVVTLGQSFVILQNQLLNFIGTLDSSTGATGLLAQGVLLVANNLDFIANVAEAAAIALGVRFAIQGVGVATAAVQRLTLAIAANPLGALAVAVTATISTLIAFSDEISFTADGMVTLADAGNAAGVVLGQRFNSALDSLGPTLDRVGVDVSELTDLFAFSFEDAARAVARALDAIIGANVGAVMAIGEAFDALTSGEFSDIGSRAATAFSEGFSSTRLFENLFDDIAEEARVQSTDRLREESAQAQQAASDRESLTRATEAHTRATQANNEAKRQSVPTFNDVRNALETEIRLLQVDAQTREQLEAVLQAEQQIKRQLTDTEREYVMAATATMQSLRDQAEIYDAIAGPVERYQRALQAVNDLQASGAITAAQGQQVLGETEIGRDVNQLRFDLASPEDQETIRLEEQFAQRQETLRTALEAEAITREEFRQLELAAETQHAQALQGLQNARFTAQLDAAQTSFDGMLQILRNTAGEESGIYRGLFGVAKAFAIAKAGLNAGIAISEAVAAGPFPANLPAIAAATVAVANFTSQIAGTNFAGNFQNGGEFRVPGAGGVDSQMISLRATPGETISVRTPQQQNQQQQQAAPAQQQGVSVVNVLDPGLVANFLTSPDGEQVLVNTIERNSTGIRQVLNG